MDTGVSNRVFQSEPDPGRAPDAKRNRQAYIGVKRGSQKILQPPLNLRYGDLYSSASDIQQEVRYDDRVSCFPGQPRGRGAPSNFRFARHFPAAEIRGSAAGGMQHRKRNPVPDGTPDRLLAAGLSATLRMDGSQECPLAALCWRRERQRVRRVAEQVLGA